MEADKSGSATPLPPDSYSPQDMLYNKDDFDDGEETGVAVLLPRLLILILIMR
jgi:hypothetical protein